MRMLYPRVFPAVDSSGDFVIDMVISLPDEKLSTFADTLERAIKITPPRYWLEKGQELRIYRGNDGRICLDIYGA